MLTITPVVLAHQQRRDGSYIVKLRVTFRRRSRYLSTALSVTPAQLTRSLALKDPTVKALAAALVRDMYGAAAGLSPFALEAMDVDGVVEYIRAQLSAPAWRLDFCTFGREWVEATIRNKGTARAYLNALHAFELWRGGPTDVNAITVPMLQDFVDALYRRRRGNGNGAGHYITLLGTVFREAKKRYNDEDAGVIRIPRSPFGRVSVKTVAAEGQGALPMQVIQAMIDTPDDDPSRFGIDLFLLSFGLMGVNVADLYEMEPPKDGSIYYLRKKISKRAGKRAAMRVEVPPQLAPIVERLRDRTGERWLSLHLRFAHAGSAGQTANYYLSDWANRHGFDRFTIYAARKSFGTLARKKAGFDRATVDECLIHVGKYKLMDTYIEKDFDLLNRINRATLELFRWPEKSHNV